MTLSDRIARMDGPSREVDWEIFCLTQPDRLPYFEEELAKTKADAEKNGTWAVRSEAIIEWQRGLYAPRYTASLDAALSLLPEGHFWSVTMRGEKRGGYHACCNRDGPLDWIEGATPALALLAAILKARGM